MRQRLHRAYATRASDQVEGEALKFDNTALMSELLALKLEEALLLGYRHFADVSLVAKMAESPEQVIAFLRDLGQRARPHAEKDLADLRAFAASELGLNDPQPWDWTYIGEKLKEAALRLQRAGSQTLLHRTQGACGPVPDCRDPV